MSGPLQVKTVFAVTGPLAALSATDRARLFDRGRAGDAEVEGDVRSILADVRTGGDAALRELSRRYDGVDLADLEIPRHRWGQALADLDPVVRQALELAAANIAAFHTAQLPAAMELEVNPGVRLGRRADPLRRVGVYAPGGRAAYPSSVLMGVVPARVAGVAEVIVCSPPGRDGLPPDAVLAACAIAGADRVFAIGGAGAIAALAYGTQSVPAVDRIVGPGNAWVTEAKRQVTGTVGIDSPAGPSEVLIIADETADPAFIAAELLAQSEHDPDAASVLVTTDAAHCAEVADHVQRMLQAQPRADVIRSALASRGALLVADDLDEAVRFAAEYAPEHLLVMTREPRALLPDLRAAGTIFLGAPSSVAFGDYITGANHVLPTAGLARTYAGLSTADFLRWTTYQELTPAAAAELAPPTIALAEAEGLPGHALAARLRARSHDPAGDDVTAPAVDGTTMPVPFRRAYASLELYDPGRTPCDTDLSDNTSLFGPAPSVRGVIAGAPDSVITRYPSVYASELKQALARLHGVDADCVVTGCGSDDIIDSAIRAFCEPGDTVAYPQPTFGMVPAFAHMNAAGAAPVPLGPDFALDADALLRRRARITYLCRPNNPTGTDFDRTAMERVGRDAAGIVLVDEAYAEFAYDDMVEFAVTSDRTVVMRTMSKAFGLAGLRVGYALGPAALMAEIEKSRGPYKVNGLAEAAALAVLQHDLDWVRARVQDVRQNRDRLAEALVGRGVRTWPSAANFLLAAVTGEAADWNRELRARGVAVRPFPGLAGAGDCIRVSVGPWPMMQAFLSAFDDVMTTMDEGRR